VQQQRREASKNRLHIFGYSISTSRNHSRNGLSALLLPAHRHYSRASNWILGIFIRSAEHSKLTADTFLRSAFAVAVFQR